MPFPGISEGLRLRFLTRRLCLSDALFRGIIAGDMPKSPPFSIVPSESAGLPPPRPLGAHGLALWNRVQAEYGIRDTGGVEILAQLCASLDRAESLREAVDRDGAVVYSARGGAPRVHPAVKDELACRAFINRSLERLGLNIESIKAGPGRPAMSMGWTGDR
jgi:hypothetical protein